MFSDMAIDLDNIDVNLLTALQADADQTNVELARLVGLSPAATLHRVRRLKESGVIRVISARLDPAAAGFPLHVYVAASLARHDPRSTHAFEEQIRALPQIVDGIPLFTSVHNAPPFVVLYGRAQDGLVRSPAST